MRAARDAQRARGARYTPQEVRERTAEIDALLAKVRASWLADDGTEGTALVVLTYADYLQLKPRDTVKNGYIGDITDVPTLRRIIFKRNDELAELMKFADECRDKADAAEAILADLENLVPKEVDAVREAHAKEAK